MVRKIKAKLVLRLRAEGFSKRQIEGQGMSRGSADAAPPGGAAVTIKAGLTILRFLVSDRLGIMALVWILVAFVLRPMLLAAHDGCAFEESYNLLNAWLSIVPGNAAYNVRRLALLETNLADLSFLFTRDPGEPTSAHLHRDALAVFETPSQTPYFYNLHVEDVGHTIVLGATGSGKSFLLNFLVTHLQQYDPLTVVLDLGHSYRKLTTLLEGSYLELGLRQQGVTINPFDLAAHYGLDQMRYFLLREIPFGEMIVAANDGIVRTLEQAGLAVVDELE